MVVQVREIETDAWVPSAPPVGIGAIFVKLMRDEAYAATRAALDDRDWDAADKMARCATGDCGGVELKCAVDETHHKRRYDFPCRSALCSKCVRNRMGEFFATTGEVLIEWPMHQVVFTLPGDLREVWKSNRGPVSELMLHEAVQVVLRVFKQRWKGTPAVIATLHLTGCNGQIHPHVHVCVSHYGLSEDLGALVGAEHNWLVPTKVLSPLWRGALLSGLTALAKEPGRRDRKRAQKRAQTPAHKSRRRPQPTQTAEATKSDGPAQASVTLSSAHGLHLPKGMELPKFFALLESVRSKRCNVFVGRAQPKPQGLLAYCVSGAYGGPIRDDQIDGVRSGIVYFWDRPPRKERKDEPVGKPERARKTTKAKTTEPPKAVAKPRKPPVPPKLRSMELTKFVAMYLQHWLPPHFKVVRYAGLYAPRMRGHLAKARVLWARHELEDKGIVIDATAPKRKRKRKERPSCPRCRGRIVARVRPYRLHVRPQCVPTDGQPRPPPSGPPLARADVGEVA